MKNKRLKKKNSHQIILTFQNNLLLNMIKAKCLSVLKLMISILVKF